VGGVWSVRGACPSEIRNQLARKRKKDHNRTLSQKIGCFFFPFYLFLWRFFSLDYVLLFFFSIRLSLSRKAVARIVADEEAQMFFCLVCD
jgi:hypothetical protein